MRTSPFGSEDPEGLPAPVKGGDGSSAWPLHGLTRGSCLTPRQAALFSGFRAESPHNVYLAVAVAAGLPTMLVYMTLIGSVLVAVAGAIRGSPASYRRTALAAVLAALSGHLVTDLSMTAELTSATTFWILMGVGLGLALARRAAPVAGVGAQLTA